MWLDGVNAGFETVGALLAWQNARAARTERPAGCSPALIAFSAAWAVECIPYYLAHGDWLSTVGAAARCLAHGVWCWRAWQWHRTPNVRFFVPSTRELEQELAK